jgi:hypothetical protein
MARPHPRIEGLIERRGEGIAHIASEPAAIIRLVIDIDMADADTDPDRLPADADLMIALHGVALPRLRLKGGASPQEQARRAFAALERDPPVRVDQNA